MRNTFCQKIDSGKRTLCVLTGVKRQIDRYREKTEDIFIYHAKALQNRYYEALFVNNGRGVFDFAVL